MRATERIRQKERRTNRVAQREREKEGGGGERLKKRERRRGEVGSVSTYLGPYLDCHTAMNRVCFSLDSPDVPTVNAASRQVAFARSVYLIEPH